MQNAKGRLAEAYTGASKTTDLGFSYSARGEVTDVYQSSPHSGGYYHVTAGYWANGLLNTLNLKLAGYPTWTYNPDGEGRVSTVTASNPLSLVTNTSYNVFGVPTGVTFGSGDSDAFAYDGNTGRMTQCGATVAALPVVSLQVTRAQQSRTYYDTDSFTPYREYSAAQGRWISPDPAGVAAVDVTNPQSYDPSILPSCGGRSNGPI